MSREIKFRAWYGEKIGMLEPSFNGNINEIFSEKNGDYMQYTGIKDKNNMEIFENDILLLESGTGYYGLQPYGMPAKNAHGEHFVVVKLGCGYVLRHVSFFEERDSSLWDAPNWCHKGWKIIDNYDFWNQHRTFTVVGNIFEHPELLEVSES